MLLAEARRVVPQARRLRLLRAERVGTLLLSGRRRARAARLQRRPLLRELRNAFAERLRLNPRGFERRAGRLLRGERVARLLFRRAQLRERTTDTNGVSLRRRKGAKEKNKRRNRRRKEKKKKE